MLTIVLSNERFLGLHHVFTLWQRLSGYDNSGNTRVSTSPSEALGILFLIWAADKVIFLWLI